MSSPTPPPDDNVVQPSSSTPETSLSTEKMPHKKTESPQVIDLTDDFYDVEILAVPTPELLEQMIKKEPATDVEEVTITNVLTSMQSATDDTALPNGHNELAEPTGATLPPITDSIELDEAGIGADPADTTYIGPERMKEMLSTFLHNHQNEGRSDSKPGYEEAVINLDSEAEEAEETAAYLAFKKRYDEKKAAGMLSFEDEIELTQAQEEEARRQKILQRKRAYQEQEESMFISENEGRDVIKLPSAPSYGDAAGSPKKKSRTSGFGRSPLAPLRRPRYESDSEEEAPPRPRGGRRGRGGRGASRLADSKSRVTKPRERKASQPASKKGGKRGPRARRPEGMLNLPSLWRNDIVGNAQRNQGREEQPGFSTKNKGKALMELLSSIPSKHRKPFAATTKELDLACRRFKYRGNGSMHADAAGGWRLKGMLSSL